MRKVLTSFVLCDRCYRENRPNKVFMPVKGRLPIPIKWPFLYNLLNGIWFHIPICCVWFFAKRSMKTKWPAGSIRAERSSKC